MAKLPRVALVGLGGYARTHLTNLQTLYQAGLCEFVAVADPYAEKQAAAVAGLQGQGIKVRDSLEALLKNDDVDAVFLATPIHLHAPQTITALEAGKHVYLEKPPCATLGEWQAMCDAQRRAGKICAVGFQMQSHSAMRFLKRAIAEGEIGAIKRVWASVRWARDDVYYARSPWAGRFALNGQAVFDGPATNALAHVVHGALSLASGETDTMPKLEKVGGVLKRARSIESYDSAFLEARTQQGCEIRLAFTHATSFNDEVVLHCEGEKGVASLNWNGEVHLNGQALRFHCDAKLAAPLDFLRAIGEESRKSNVTIQDTLPYLQMVHGARQSSGGAQDFETSLIERDEERKIYRVAGLDEQMSAFAADFESCPALVATGRSALLPVEELELTFGQ